MWGIEAEEGKVLRRKGSTERSENRHATVTDPDEWEEIDAAGQPSQTKAEYDAEVERLIALRYSYGKEIEVNRERDSKPAQFAAYLEYVEECKVRAREIARNAKTIARNVN
jgi:hypothetical protein